MMKRILIAVALVLVGCGHKSPTGVALVFPSDTAQMQAATASVQVIDPSSDDCTQYLAFATPDPGKIVFDDSISFANGMPVTVLKNIPSGRRTLLIKVKNSQALLYLIGCVTADLSPNKKVDVILQDVNLSPPDLVTDDTGPPDMVAPPDMALKKTLNITVSELRDTMRKLSGANIIITDSATMTRTGTTDATGVVKIDTAGLTPPFTVSAAIAPSAGHQGFTQIAGISPNFGATDSANLTLPIELDPPAMLAGNNITVSESETLAQGFDLYWQYSQGIPGDLQTINHASAPFTEAGPNLVAGSSYRVASVTTDKIATPQAPLAVGATFPVTMLSGYTALDKAFTLDVKPSGNVAYNDQKYAVSAVLSASITQAYVPLLKPTAMPGSNMNVAAGKVPTMATSIQASAVIQAEQVATGASARGELRIQLPSTSPSNGAFTSAVPDPPTVPAVAAVSASMPYSIMATVTSAPSANGYVHVSIHDTGDPASNKTHGHLFMPATASVTVNVPGNVLTAGSHSADVAFVENFTLSDGTIGATLADDWTKLIRVRPQKLAQTTTAITLN